MKTLKIIGIVVAIALVAFGVYSYQSAGVKYGDNSTLSGGLTVQLSNTGDTFTTGTGINTVAITSTGNITAAGIIYSKDGLVEGGIDSIATTSTSYTLVQNDLLNYSFISFTPNGGNTTLTLPASTTLTSWLANAGDSAIEAIHNASSTAGVTLTVAAGTGTLVQNASSTLVINPLKDATIRCIRKANTDVVCLFTPYF